MPKLDLVKVMFAHPSDASKYLPMIERTFEEANENYGILKSVDFKVFSWERDAYRQWGDTQKLINSQLVEPADIVLAVFEGKLGTPIHGYESGTDEEIHKAHDEYGNDHVWVYFSINGYNAAKPVEKKRLKRYKKSLRIQQYPCMDFCGSNSLKKSISVQIRRYLEQMMQRAKTAPGMNENEGNNGFNDNAATAKIISQPLSSSGKTLNVDTMSKAVKNTISHQGLGVLADATMFKSTIGDFIPGSYWEIARELLISSIKRGVGKELLKAASKTTAERVRALSVAGTILIEECMFSQRASDSILKVFASALGWGDVAISGDVRHSHDVLHLHDVLQKQQKKPDEITEKVDDPFVKGAVIPFGKYYKWRVLFVKGKTALLLADEITDVGIPYNLNFGDVSWERSWIREWLNSEFLKRFSQAEQKRILTHRTQAETNPWYRTDAGAQTWDKVYLLSITELISNLGDNEQLRLRPKNSWMDVTSADSSSRAIDDRYNDARCARHKGEKTWWWLRSPGESKSKAAYVNANGVVFLSGELVGDDGGTSSVGIRPGVRPAIWLQQ
ncbi:MAG: DUF6273 domain-containing protein [Clostridiales Family XIII bacterium]|nr:DUF6273 domain-containing protein [Clostridiales Family XIII bacterium]